METLNLCDYPRYIEEFKNFIKQTNPISPQAWKELQSIMTLYRVPKGVRLLDYMKVESAVRFLGKGIVKCEDHYNNKSFVYDFRVAPIVLSETVSLLNKTPSRITLETICECDFIELPRDIFLGMAEIHTDLAFFCLRGVANYLGMTHYKQALLRTLSAEERYKHFLKEFPSVVREAKLEDISSYIGVRQQSLSRIRKNIVWLDNEKEFEALSNELAVVHRQKD